MKHICKFFDTTKIVVKSFPKIIKALFVLGIIGEAISMIMEKVPLREGLKFFFCVGLCFWGYVAIMHLQRLVNEERFFETMTVLGGGKNE